MGTPNGTPPASGFRTRAIAEVEGTARTQRWLVESLWAEEGVGILGGTPKTGKTWATLELAISVASGRPAFGRFEVPQPGPVVVYPAEDHPGAMRNRIEMLCKHKGLTLDGLPLYLLEAEQVHLDEEGDRESLEAVLAQHQPRLLVLDPLVRLHKGSESNAQHIAELLGYLRSVQRRFQVAIAVTHHLAKQKTKAAGLQPGQALRGSGDLHAWGDSNLYLSKLEGGVVAMTVEHRQAPSLEEPLYYKLSLEGEAAWLEVLDELPEHVVQPVASQAARPSRAGGQAVAAPLDGQILEALAASGGLSQVELRKQLRVRNQKLTEVLRQLVATKRIERQGRRWVLCATELEPEGAL